MKILLSIKPQFVDKIVNGDKKYEFRRILPKRVDIKQIVVYASSPICKVVGEIEIDEIITDSIDSIWIKTGKNAGLSHEEFLKYFNGKSQANAIKIKKFTPYQIQKSLKEVYPGIVAPQSFCYVEDD